MTKSTITRERLLEIIVTGPEASGAEQNELARMALAAMDSEPVILYRERNPYNGLTTGWQELTENEFSFIKENAGENAEFLTLYRHVQPAPVVPDDVLEALQKVARIRLDLNDFDGDRRGIADCLCDAEEALIEVVNRRAAMLHAGNSPAQSDCCPAQNSVVPAQSGNSPAIPDGYVLVPKEATKGILDEFDSIIYYGAEDSVDAWHRLLAAATQEVKP
ncbi:TPA: hypothetical protein ACWXAD_003828 [Klebsiella quasipneumoniae subsp. similipneumoniae]